MFQEGQQIGGYTLIKRIGRGGFGEVWLAERRTALLTTKVAVKLPHDSLVNLETVRKEAVLWEQASGHANVLPIIEANIYDGQIVFVSEYAPDGSLADLLKREGQISIEDAVRFTIGITAGLEFLHSRRIIHRDLKPANILLQGETPRLADFGISHALQTAVSSRSENIKGTFSYMPPEAFDGKRNEQTDIWSIGVILYRMLQGGLPFPQENSTELFGAIVMREPEPLAKEIPAKLKELVGKCLAKNPENRYQSAKDLRLDLEKILVGITHRSFAETEVLTPENFEIKKDSESETEIETDISTNPVRKTDDVAETEPSEEPEPASENGKSIPLNVRHLADKKLKKRNPLQTFIAAILLVIFVTIGSLMLYGFFRIVIEKKTDISNTNQNNNQKQTMDSNKNNLRDVNTILQEQVNAVKNMPNNNTSNTKPPKTADDYFSEGNKFYYLKEYEQAVASFSKCIELDTKKKADCYNRRGMAYHEKGDFDKSIDNQTKAIELNPSDWFYFQRGKSYMGKLMYLKAIEDFNQSIKIDSKHPNAYVLRGDAYYKMTGFPTPSIGDYCTALKLDKDNKGAKQGLARVPNAKCP